MEGITLEKAWCKKKLITIVLSAMLALTFTTCDISGTGSSGGYYDD